MKKAIIYVDVCRECPFFDDEAEYCAQGDIPLVDIATSEIVHENCPLDDN